MKTILTREEIISRINYSGTNDFRVITYNNIINANNLNDALSLFESNDVFALVINEKWPGNIGEIEMIIAYKAGSFPVDIYHLIRIRNILIEFDLLALENGATVEGFMLLHSDMNALSSFFTEYYLFSPELIDEKRLSIIRKINDMYEAKLLHNYNKISKLCDEIIAELDVMINESNISSGFSNEGTLTIPKI